jgi:hypothetical protein
MPIYEFFCPQTHKIYSFYARSISMAGKTPRCPDNPKYRMERMISSFSFTGRKREERLGAAGEDDAAMDDPRMERAMAEMERDFSGMDEENPDPKQLARMMRKMSSLTGEKLPETMDEMIRRMEAGEDPEKLEAEYGDALEEFDPMGSGGDGAAEKEGGEKNAPRGKRKSLKRRRIIRDPTLYEMSEYVSE